MYDDILIPVDGSDGSERGVEYGLDIARKYKATVHTLYVIDRRTYGDTPALSSDELFFEQIEDHGEEALQVVEEKAEDLGLDVVSVCKRGIPHEVILEYTEDEDIDLIVMGRHGHSEFQVPHIGSCTDRVIRLAKIPVLPV
ncbi:universal stress protein (plasmid) [Haloferax mediterranei ATCC 33500]|uniref:Universal stress protein n=2 Tax=Haloferax mediterranei TaxID=2252 RepID=I3R9Z5_HALMT|nr:universal stress protein [Haloferax mediterranei]ACB10371.1 universal stress protein [Haloferax mediterranei]AFK21055.1 universal stress protein [Haloferax mediterranei ATCC 33500]AHZ24085.1 universal stress protein UspA [Haloferax mediterranei ATCC 33500]EMA05160.1 universal stress protein [Haloferax mediterranei ATCC 33500]MDX5989765.1 universal stress protein [Haloferax mediterranei ATCC 33500]